MLLSLKHTGAGRIKVRVAPWATFRLRKIMWGVIETEEFIHVIPCSEKLEIRRPHIIEWYCECNPDLLQDNGGGTKLILSHRELH